MLSYEDDINILNSHRNYDNNTEKKISRTSCHMETPAKRTLKPWCPWRERFQYI